MRVLVVGSGGREHALVWKLRESSEVSEIFCAPGNAGIASLASCVAIDPSDIVELADFAEKISVGLTLVGPELPLTLGLADELQKRGLAVFGPTQAAAELEASKAFSKEFMRKHQIPTADFHVVNSVDEAHEVIASGRLGWPLVVKAHGLAGGKGVAITEDAGAARATVEKMMEAKAFGSAGKKVVLEEFLHGEEVSFFVLSDGSKVLPLATVQDHKRAFDLDQGPNTGGMGCVCPATLMSAELHRKMLHEIALPTISGMAAEGRRFQGVLYCGLMVTADGPRVLEYNVRFGDPEAQTIVPRLKNDLLPILKECAEEDLGQHKLDWRRDPAVTVVLASGGYPEHYEVGKPISGLDAAGGLAEEGVTVFHAGTKREQGEWVTAGGRVLAVTAVAQNLKAAIDLAYGAVARIHFDGMHYRKDIGQKALARLTGGGA